MTMTDPYQVLGIPPDADDAAVRARYLELVRRWPPEQAPEQLAQALDALKQPANGDDAARPLVKAVMEAYDALTRTTAEIDRLREGATPAGPPSLWRRLFGRRDDATTADRLAAAVTGLRMSEARVERLMREVGLEPVECVGRPSDPES